MPSLLPQDLELQHLMVTAIKVVLELHIPQQHLLLGEKKIQHRTSTSWLIYHLEQKIVIYGCTFIPV